MERQDGKNGLVKENFSREFNHTNTSMSSTLAVCIISSPFHTMGKDASSLSILPFFMCTDWNGIQNIFCVWSFFYFACIMNKVILVCHKFYIFIICIIQFDALYRYACMFLPHKQWEKYKGISVCIFQVRKLAWEPFFIGVWVVGR